jgi:Holliday junction resolvasome RuvABC endonuclease subunit
MKILGVDPGYRNLGLCLVEVSSSGKIAQVIYSKNMSVGKATAPLAFTKFLWPELEEIHKNHGPIEAVASETPPFIMGQIKTTAFLWAVSSIVVAWSHVKQIPFRHASPISLKRAVCRGLGREWDKRYIPKKSEVKLLITRLTGQSCTTSHENDAALAALLMFSKMIDDD